MSLNLRHLLHHLSVTKVLHNRLFEKIGKEVKGVEKDVGRALDKLGKTVEKDAKVVGIDVLKFTGDATADAIMPIVLKFALAHAGELEPRTRQLLQRYEQALEAVGNAGANAQSAYNDFLKQFIEHEDFRKLLGKDLQTLLAAA